MINLITCMPVYLMCFVSTYWAIKQYEKQQKHQSLLQRQKSLNSTAREHIENRLSLEDILATKDGFDVFANHLVKEFSIENLFFVYEMVQIKNELHIHQLSVRILIWIQIRLFHDNIICTE